jgi:hypothetical protein
MDDKDGTVRVSTGDRREARRRFDEALAEGNTVSDRGAGRPETTSHRARRSAST